MGEKSRLLQQLDQAREQMRAVLASIDAQAEVYSNWTIKQVLAHITGWDDITTSWLRAHAVGDENAAPAVRGIDSYNAESVAARDALSYEEIVKEWEWVRDQLKTAISEMPSATFKETMRFPWGQSGSAAQIVLIMAHHEEEHADEIRQTMQ